MGRIYFVANLNSGRAYVGQTTKTVPERWDDHVRQAREGLPFALHRGVRKHGPEAFEQGLLEECEDSKTDERERFWIEALGTTPSVTDSTPSCEAGIARRHGTCYDPDSAWRRSAC